MRHATSSPLRAAWMWCRGSLLHVGAGRATDVSVGSPVPPAAGRSHGGGAMTKANILLVDDQQSNLLALEAVLDGSGLNLARARTGEEALRTLESEEFAAVLLDIRMPGM